MVMMVMVMLMGDGDDGNDEKTKIMKHQSTHKCSNQKRYNGLFHKYKTKWWRNSTYCPFSGTIDSPWTIPCGTGEKKFLFLKKT